MCKAKTEKNETVSARSSPEVRGLHPLLSPALIKHVKLGHQNCNTHVKHCIYKYVFIYHFFLKYRPRPFLIMSHWLEFFCLVDTQGFGYSYQFQFLQSRVKKQFQASLSAESFQVFKVFSPSFYILKSHQLAQYWIKLLTVAYSWYERIWDQTQWTQGDHTRSTVVGD